MTSLAVISASVVARALLTTTVAMPEASAGRAIADIDPCVAQRLPGLERALAFELGQRSRVSRDPAAAPPHITFRCDGTQISIGAVSSDGATRLDRVLDLLSTPAAAHARLTAVAAIELAEPLWGGNEKHEAIPPAEIAAPIATAETPGKFATHQRDGDQRDVAFWRLALVGDARAFRGGPDLLLGGGVSLSAGWTQRPWLATVDLIADHTSQNFTLGRGTVTLISTRPALLASLRLGVATVVGGAGVRLGIARIAGEAATPAATAETFWGWWGGPQLLVGTSIAVARQVGLTGMIEAGWSPAEVVGREGSVRAIAVGGPWVGVQLGIDLHP